MKKLKQILTNLWSKKWLRFSLLSTLSLLFIGELVARFYLGLGSTPIYVESEEYEYIYAPNQDVKRFGNRIVTNEYSMRSLPLSKNDGKRILLIGDSVINGGPHVDHEDLVSTLLENHLKKTSKNIRVLNISAGSWGPDNAFAYIDKHGHFNSELIVLVFSSHDYNDNMHHRKVVGEHPMWPDSQPLTALGDGFFKYALPKIKSWFGVRENEYAYLVGFDDSGVNSGWQNFIDYCEINQIDLLIYHHPETNEVKEQQWNKKGVKLQDMLTNYSLEVINGLEYEITVEGYRDNIHLDKDGHFRLYEALLDPIKSKIQ